MRESALERFGNTRDFLIGVNGSYARREATKESDEVRAHNKARDIRLIKLRFSRMLLYASGVLAIGRGYGLSLEDKLESLQTLLGKYPIDRIWSVVGEKAEPVFDLYAGFLEALTRISQTHRKAPASGSC